jgi:hypothetical protein
MVTLSEDLNLVQAGAFGISGGYAVSSAVETSSGVVTLSVNNIPTDFLPDIYYNSGLMRDTANNWQNQASTTTASDGLCPPDIALDSITSDAGEEKTLSVSWNSYSSPTDIALYKIYWSSNPFSNVSSATYNNSTTGKTYDITSLDNDTTYWVAVIGRDTSSNEDPVVTSSTGIPVDQLAPDKMTQVSAKDKPTDTGGSVIVEWTKGVAADINGYRVYYALQIFTDISQATYFAGSPAADSNASSCTVTGLTSDTQDYYFGVTAVDTENNYDTAVTQCVGPIRAIDNQVDTTSSDDTIASDEDPDTYVIIDQGTNNGIFIDVVEPGSSKQNLIDLANNNALQNSNFILPTVNELIDTDIDFQSSSSLTGEVTVSISYPSNITGSQENYLRICRLNETSGVWVPVNTREGKQQVDKTKKTVTASLSGFSIYRVMGVVFASSNLDNVAVYPNPFKPTDGNSETGTWDQGIYFGGLAPEVEVQIFTIAGELVDSFDKTEIYSGRYQWKVPEDTASGVYIYLLKNTDDDGDKTSGKFAIIK